MALDLTGGIGNSFTDANNGVGLTQGLGGQIMDVGAMPQQMPGMQVAQARNAGTVTINPGTHIGGDVINSRGQVHVSPGATVGGSIHQQSGGNSFDQNNNGINRRNGLSAGDKARAARRRASSFRRKR